MRLLLYNINKCLDLRNISMHLRLHSHEQIYNSITKIVI